MTRLAFRWLVALALLGACDGTIGDPGSGPGPDGRRPGEPIDSRLEPRVWRLSPALYESELDRLFGEGVPDGHSAGRSGVRHHGHCRHRTRWIRNASAFVEAARVVGTWASTSPSATRCADPAASTCIDTLLEWLPEEAFRRPVTNETSDVISRSTTRSRRSTRLYALGGVLRAVLLSPEFLYRTELGGAQTRPARSSWTITRGRCSPPSPSPTARRTPSSRRRRRGTTRDPTSAKRKRAA
ncbi:MAG: DUF1595 domain-containing protein [Polyangiales bacterium]